MSDFAWKENDVVEVEQNALTCFDCIYKTRMAGICPQYPSVKPKGVLDGGKCVKKVSK